MATVLLRRTSATLKEKLNEFSSDKISVYRDQVSSLFKAVSHTLTQQIQLAIKAKRYEVHKHIICSNPLIVKYLTDSRVGIVHAKTDSSSRMYCQEWHRSQVWMATFVSRS